MAHHVDAEVVMGDSRLNIVDMYLCGGASTDVTAIISTINSDTGVLAPLSPSTALAVLTRGYAAGLMFGCRAPTCAM